MSDNSKIIDIELDDSTVIRLTPEIKHERAAAIADLLEKNYFFPRNAEAVGDGPYRLKLSMADHKLIIDIEALEEDMGSHRVLLPLKPFRRIIKDYFMVCESYYEAIKTASPDKMQAIDMGRRGLHNEGSELLLDYLRAKIDFDEATARRFFTLISVLHLK